MSKYSIIFAILLVALVCSTIVAAQKTLPRTTVATPEQITSQEVDVEMKIIERLVNKTRDVLAYENDVDNKAYLSVCQDLLNKVELSIKTSDPAAYATFYQTFASSISAYKMASDTKAYMQSLLDRISAFLAAEKQKRIATKSTAAPGLSIRQPAISCGSISRNSKAHRTAPNALYWINPSQANFRGTFLMVCDMQRGAWGLVGKIGSSVDRKVLGSPMDVDEVLLLRDGTDSQFLTSTTEQAFFNAARFDSYENKWTMKIVYDNTNVIYLAPNPADTPCTLQKALRDECAQPLFSSISKSHVFASDIYWTANTVKIGSLTGALAIFATQ